MVAAFLERTIWDTENEPTVLRSGVAILRTALAFLDLLPVSRMESHPRMDDPGNGRIVLRIGRPFPEGPEHSWDAEPFREWSTVL